MGYLTIPLLLLFTIGPGSKDPDKALSDFSRFSKALNAQIALVDRDGTVREGVLANTTGDDVTMRFGSGTRLFARAEIMSAERLRDSSKDGALKGALFGALIGLLVAQGFDSDSDAYNGWLGSVAVSAGIGWAIDNAQSHRHPIYRAPASPAAAKPTVKMSLHF